jgi:hypothetical protein
MRNLHHMSVCVDGAGVSHAKCRRVSPVAGMSSAIVRPIASGSGENFHLSPLFAPTHAMVRLPLYAQPCIPRNADSHDSQAFLGLQYGRPRVPAHRFIVWIRMRLRYSVSRGRPGVTCMTSETCSGTKGAIAAPLRSTGWKEKGRWKPKPTSHSPSRSIGSSVREWVVGDHDECRRRRRGR